MASARAQAHNDPPDTQRHVTSQSLELQHLPKHVHFDRSNTPRLSGDSEYESARSSADMNDSIRSKRSVDLAKEQDGGNEHSPLLAARTSDDELTLVPPMPTDTQTSPVRSTFDAQSQDIRQDSKSSWYLFLLTLSMLGLQIGWSVELSNGSPYLLSLGISKSLLAFVWIAGPLSGTLVQPYVGIKSDRCRLRYGKRRPFMLGGMVATIISLIGLGWTQEMVSAALGLFGLTEDSKGVKVTVIVVAVLVIYVLDFAINVVQAAIRAFIVDNAPSHQQDSANAWASRMAGFGNIIGYLFGFVNLPKYVPVFGNTQFKVLCWLASISMALTIQISCFAITERDPSMDPLPSKQEDGLVAFFKTLYRSVRNLSPEIRRVCAIQFFAWIGWFPFLFYITTYVGEIYSEHYYAAQPDMTQEEIEYFWQQGTRAGTFALFIFAIVNFAASVLLPFVVAKSYKSADRTMDVSAIDDSDRLSQAETPTTPTVAATAAGGYFGYQPAATADDTLSTKSTTRTAHLHFLRHLPRLPHLEIPWLTLNRTWLLSHLLFALLTWSTLLITSVTGATILVALIGIPWAITQWIPFTLIAAEIRKRETVHSRHSDIDDDEPADQAGVVLGIHNVAIAAPQVIATLVSSAIFRALQKPRGSVGDDSVAWVLRFGGLAALVAAWLTWRMGQERNFR